MMNDWSLSHFPLSRGEAVKRAAVSLTKRGPQMYAVIQTGGKQYKVSPGEVVQVEKLEGEIGAATKFSEVLLVAKPGTDSTTIWLGKPT